MKFNDVENKEKYFMQPYVDSNPLLINILMHNKICEVKAFNKKNKQIKLLKKIENELISLYRSSNFYGFEIFLKGFITLTKKRKQLMVYDILLKNEYDLKSQSKRYSTRLENLNIRFLKIKTKHVKSIFTFKFNEKNLDHIIKQFIKTNLIDGIVFHKDIPYKYEEDEVIIENVCKEYEGIIVDSIVGTVVKQTVNEETNTVEKYEEVPCVHFLKCKIDEDIIDISLDNFLDNEKIKIFNNFDSIKNTKCKIKYFNILEKSGYFIVNFEK